MHGTAALYPNNCVPIGADDFTYAANDIACRMNGVAGQQMSDAGISNVKVVGKHTFNDVCEVQVRMCCALLLFTQYNRGPLCQGPCIGVQGPLALTVRMFYLFNGRHVLVL